MADKNDLTVDEFIEIRVQPEFHTLVQAIRRLIKDTVPDVTEYITYGIPAYRLDNIIAVISPTKKDITLSFSRGAHFNDEHGLLDGVGNVSKFVKMKTLDELKQYETALHDYLKQAIALDKTKG